MHQVFLLSLLGHDATVLRKTNESTVKGSARQLDPDVRAGAGAVRHVSAASVRVCDRLDDREPEAGATGPAACMILAAEALEGASDEVGPESRSPILHVDRHLPIGRVRTDG